MYVGSSCDIAFQGVKSNWVRLKSIDNTIGPSVAQTERLCANMCTRIENNWRCVVKPCLLPTLDRFAQSGVAHTSEDLNKNINILRDLLPIKSMQHTQYREPSILPASACD